MISLGEEGLTPRQRASQMSAGLGLVEDVIIDQHFDQRSATVGSWPWSPPPATCSASGIDENTAIEIRDGAVITVIGAGAIFVVDAATPSRTPPTPGAAPRSSSPARSCTPCPGRTFDLCRACELTDFVERHPDI